MKTIITDFITDCNRKGFNLDTVRFDKPNLLSISVGPNSRLNLHSCAKTITAIGLGIAANKFKLSLEEKVLDFFPEFLTIASKGSELISIKDLLHMNAGKRIQSLLETTNNKNWQKNWALWFWEEAITSTPGNQFYYSSHCCYIIGRIIERLSNKDINSFLSENLWLPLNIPKVNWEKCPLGYTNCAGNIWLTNEELSKIGTLLLGFGDYEGKELLSKEYVRSMIFDIVPSEDPFGRNDVECSCGYGYYIWKCSPSDTFRIWGAGANFCIIDYKNNCCLTITAKKNINWKDYNDHDVARAGYLLIKRLCEFKQ